MADSAVDTNVKQRPAKSTRSILKLPLGMSAFARASLSFVHQYAHASSGQSLLRLAEASPIGEQGTSANAITSGSDWTRGMLCNLEICRLLRRKSGSA